MLVELQRVDHTQHFVDVTTQRQIVYDPGGEQYRLRQSERVASATPSSDVFDKCFLNFTLHVGDHCVFHPANAAFYRQGCYAMRQGQTQSRKKRRLLQRRASGIPANVLSKAISQTANKSEVHRPGRNERSSYHWCAV